MPAILGANSVSGYEIKNSLRFEDGDEASLTKTYGSAGNRRTWSFSCWFKRAKLPDNTDNIANKDVLFCAVNNDNNLRISDDRLQFYLYDGSADYGYITTAVVRDQSAWYHVLFVLDTTNSTANQRMRLYLNGTEIGNSRYQDYADPPENFQGVFNSAGAHSVGRAISNQESDYYLADVNFVDGTALTPTSFAETDDNGNWIPIKYAGSYGSNGFFMEFKQTGTSADASGKGADTSGNGNHFTPQNMTAEDITTDTPTNNFATINPLNTFPATPPTLSEGNLQCRTVNADPGYFGGSGTIGVSTGKWYFEVKPTVTTSGQPFFIGVSYEPEEMARQGATASAQYLAPTYLYYGHNGNKFNNGSNSSYGDSYAADDIVGVALDLDNHKLYFSKNGTFQNSGDPTTGSTGTGSAFNLTTGKTYFPVLADGGGSVTTYQLNFGSPPFAISSGNTDAEGFGNFEFAVPSGYFALCSKNLAEYGG